LLICQLAAIIMRMSRNWKVPIGFQIS
jgi:hypothetical protein